MSYAIYEQLRNAAGVRDTDVVKATGIRNATFTDWKAGRYEPKSDKRQKIADYFGVTLYYLDTGINAPEVLQLSPDLMQIVETFIKRPGARGFMRMCNDLNETQYNLIWQLVKELSGEGHNDKNTEDPQD